MSSYALRKNIIVASASQCPSFVAQVAQDLKTIEANAVGKELIQRIGKSSREIFIAFDQEKTSCTPKSLSDASLPGVGSSALIWYSPKKPEEYISFECEPLATPKHVELTHELIHGWLCGEGKMARSKCADMIVWTDDCEYQAIVGLDPKAPPITENSFRIEEGLKQRFSHHRYQALDDKFINSRIHLLAKKHLQSEGCSVVNLTKENLQPDGGGVVYAIGRALKKTGQAIAIRYTDSSLIPEAFPAMQNLDLDSPFIQKFLATTPEMEKIRAIGLYRINEDQRDSLLKFS